MARAASTVRSGKVFPAKSRAYRYVAVRDVCWLAMLFPIGAAFRVLLLLARGFYACRRRGAILAALYTGAVLCGVGWLIYRVVRLRGRRR